MIQPVWNPWTAVVVLGLLGSGLYLAKIGQIELGGVCIAGAVGLAGVTERAKP